MLSALCLAFTPRVKQNFESRKQVGSERLRSDRKPNKTNLQLLGGVSAQRNLEADVKREKMPWSFADFKFSSKKQLADEVTLWKF